MHENIFDAGIRFAEALRERDHRTRATDRAAIAEGLEAAAKHHAISSPGVSLGLQAAAQTIRDLNNLR